MPRYSIRYQQRDPAEEARKAAAANFQQQRQIQTSAYAAARFNEWAAGAQDREALLNARLQNQQSEAELKGAQFRYNFWKDNELRRQTTAYYIAMPALQEQLKNAGIFPGSPRYAAEMSTFAAELPYAVTHNEAIRNDLKNYAKVDATSAEIASKINTIQQAFAQTNQRPTSFTTTAAGGVDVKATRPIDEGLKAIGLSPTEFLNHVNAKQGKFDDQGKFTQSLNPGEQANAIQFQAGAKKDDVSQLVTHSMPLQQFNQLRSGLGVPALPAFVSGQQGAPQATQTPIPDPRFDLARRALADPNATDAHKDAARQILGVTGVTEDAQ